jgi:ribosomal protein S18 acetylase RimI-like enzyme
MFSAFVTRAVRFVIFKTAVFAMEWVKLSVKSAFWGIIFFYKKYGFKVESI